MRASLLVLAGCLHGHPGADAWHAISTAHFEMWTDGDVATAKETLTSFEHARSIILGVLAPDFDSHRKTLVVAFVDQRETDQYIHRGYVAETFWSSPLLEPLIVMSADAARLNERVLVHELAHAVSGELMRKQPAWFAEGLASYFESVTLEGSTVEVGKPSPDRTRSIRSRISVANAMRVSHDDRSSPGFYTTAWLIFSYLINANRPALDAYEAKLRHGNTAFSEVPDLQEQVDLWLSRNQISSQRYKLSVKAWPATEHALPTADVMAIEGLLAHDDNQLATARQLDPTNLIVALAKKPTIEVARTVAAAHPDDWRAAFLVALTSTGDEQRGAIARACALVGRSDDPSELLKCSR